MSLFLKIYGGRKNDGCLHFLGQLLYKKQNKQLDFCVNMYFCMCMGLDSCGFQRAKSHLLIHAYTYTRIYTFVFVYEMVGQFTD